MQNQMQPIMSPQMPPRSMPSGFTNIRRLPQVRPDLGEDQTLPVRPIFNFPRRPINLPRRPRRIIPERMPSRRPTPRFFGGGLRNIFSRLPNQRARERMSPPLPRAPLPMPVPETQLSLSLARPSTTWTWRLSLEKVFLQQRWLHKE